LAGKGAAVADSLYDTQKVPYLKLAQGLNTLKAPHDLARSELSALTNAWYAYGQSLSKRPGTVPTGSYTGATGGGVAGRGVVTARFNDVTYVLVQQGSSVWAAAPGVPNSTWTLIGTVTAAGTLRGAQMFDPSTQKDTLFVVTGYDVPQLWLGPGTVLVKVKTGYSSAGLLPNKPNTLTPITPAFVSTLGNNSHLFYSGEPSAPSAVYISDPFYPQSFTTPAMQADPYGYTGAGGIFTPALIGFNDGVDGGNITGLQTMGFAMVVFKEAAIYAMVQTQLLGNVAWQVYNVCSSRGALSPRSIVAFETFTAFQSIDGIYITYGQPQEDMTQQKISRNVPSYFDSTRFGQPALITNRTSAVAVREGNRYIIWFDTGQGVPTTGVWFDFDVQGDQSMPGAGEIDGMAVGGAATLAGPNDTGNFVWCDALQDRIGLFGIGFADFGEPITVTISGKVDYFDDLYGPQAPLMNKVPSRCDLIVVPFTGQASQTLQFVGSFGVDYATPVPSSVPVPTLSAQTGTGLWGDTWGAFNWTSGAFAESGYFIGTLRPQKSAFGHLIGITIAESSIYPWILLGYILELNAHEVTR
jgi:hypothetical protein